MKLIIDTNLLFSSISKPDGKIAEIILNPNFHLKITGCKEPRNQREAWRFPLKIMMAFYLKFMVLEMDIFIRFF